MQLPKPISTQSATLNRLADAVSLELFYLQQIYALAEQGIAHDSNRRDAGRIAADIHSLANEAETVAPIAEARTWLTRARYAASLMETEIKQENAA